MQILHQRLTLIEEARKAWPFEEDPGLGLHEFGGFTLNHWSFGEYEFDGFLLHVTEHEKTKGQIETRYCLIHDDEGHPLSMSYNWDGLHENLINPDPPFKYFKNTGEEDMTKSSVQDQDLRAKIKLKCINDWGLDLSDDQISMCIYEMEEQQLSLFHGQLWPNKRTYKKGGDYKVRVTWDKSIEGYRAVAHKIGTFAGVEAPVFTHEDIENSEEKDLVASVTVYRLGPNGRRHPYVGEARFSEFVQMVDEYNNKKKTGKKIPNYIWKKSPKNQLAVAAERQALRKAFQSCDDEQKLPVLIEESAKPDREPAPEKGRGEQMSDEAYANTPEPAKASKPKAAPTPETKPKAEAKTEPKSEEPKEEPKGKYVGIPKGGFKASAKYNKGERIIMLAATKDGSVSTLALDSGFRVTVNAEGFETDRRKRKDKLKGGRKWDADDAYYDGSKVTKVADSKQDEFAIRLLLDSNFEVRLDRWGKEGKRKKREKKVDKSKGEGTLVTKGQRDKKKTAPPEHDPAVGGDVAPTTATKSPEAKAAGNNGPVDIEKITDVAMLRKHTEPLLKKWCTEITKKRVSFKTAYSELVGVVLQKGQTMGLDDYKVLYECLSDAIEEASGQTG